MYSPQGWDLFVSEFTVIIRNSLVHALVFKSMARVQQNLNNFRRYR